MRVSQEILYVWYGTYHILPGIAPTMPGGTPVIILVSQFLF